MARYRYFPDQTFGTERYLVTFPVERPAEGAADLARHAEAVMLDPTVERPSALGRVGADRSGIVFPRLGAAVIRLTPGGLDRVLDHRGRNRASDAGAHRQFQALQMTETPPAAGQLMDDELSTWGLKAIGLAGGGTGKGVRVAILDTGFGPSADFVNRVITRESFEPDNPDTTDRNGHGTMCAGIACGNKTAQGRRYGIASEADIFIGRVLNAVGAGRPEWVIAGMEWAVSHECHVISLSLGMEGAETRVSGFDELARRALRQGTIVIAAAGDSAPETVVQPAGSQSIIAVAAIDSDGKLYPGSCPSGKEPGEEVNLAAPGVAVWSIVPSNSAVASFACESGTSLAVPHVAGVAALLSEQGFSGQDLWQRLIENTKPLPKCQPKDVGNGLVQAS